jgi:hypothetical protein
LQAINKPRELDQHRAAGRLMKTWRKEQRREHKITRGAETWSAYYANLSHSTDRPFTPPFKPSNCKARFSNDGLKRPLNRAKEANCGIVREVFSAALLALEQRNQEHTPTRAPSHTQYTRRRILYTPGITPLFMVSAQDERGEDLSYPKMLPPTKSYCELTRSASGRHDPPVRGFTAPTIQKQITDRRGANVELII